MEDIFSFEDFLSGKNIKKEVLEKPLPKKEIEKVDESVILDTKEEIDNSKEDVEVVEIEQSENSPIEEIPVVEEKFYPLYMDRGENFQCDIYVEGAKTDETITRLIVETDEWSLMFPGEIKNGKVNIPIRKLSIFEEGQIGKVRLEVIAEGTLFIPWEDEFKIKMSKKVTVNMNETNKPKPQIKKTGVKVSVNK